jgi:hypothetical protein
VLALRSVGGEALVNRVKQMQAVRRAAACLHGTGLRWPPIHCCCNVWGGGGGGTGRAAGACTHSIAALNLPRAVPSLCRSSPLTRLRRRARSCRLWPLC